MMMAMKETGKTKRVIENNREMKGHREICRQIESEQDSKKRKKERVCV